MKRILKIVAIVVAVLLVILIAIPFLINVNSFRPRIEAEASQALGRPVKVGNLSLSILSGSVSADNISIAEDPAFGTNPFVTAKSLKVGVEVMPLITSKELRVTDITLEKPEITSVIIGARNLAQLEDNLGATAVHVSPEIMTRLEDATRIAPEYPGVFIDFIQAWLGNR